MSKWQLVIDVASCEGCNNCLMACKDEHVGNDWPPYTRPQQLHGDRWIWVSKRERGAYPHVDVAYRPTPCMHCESPACAAAAPDAIVQRPDGIVLIDQEKAKGRKELVDACPYHAIQWNEELQVAQKCTLCAHLIDDGWSKPRCVQACPTGALSIVKLEDSQGAAPELEVLHPEYNTRPTVRYANMYRYDKCFVGGSIAKRDGGTEDCIKGATVRLYKGDLLVGQATTDGFGDFRFDRLQAGQTGLSLKVEATGFDDLAVPVNAFPESINVGTLYLKHAARQA